MHITGKESQGSLWKEERDPNTFSFIGIKVDCYIERCTTVGVHKVHWSNKWMGSST